MQKPTGCGFAASNHARWTPHTNICFFTLSVHTHIKMRIMDGLLWGTGSHNRLTLSRAGAPMLPTNDSPDHDRGRPSIDASDVRAPETQHGAHRSEQSSSIRDATPMHDDGDELTRRRVQIYWSGDKRWFTGVVIRAAEDKHYILYEDGDAKWHDLRHEEVHGQLRWLDVSSSSSSPLQEPEYPRVILRLRVPKPRPAAPSGSLPAGVCPGGFCLAFGLHAGRRDQFKAKLLRVRTIAPEFLVRYIADVDGCTNELLLPEVRRSTHAAARATQNSPVQLPCVRSMRHARLAQPEAACMHAKD